MTAGLDKGADYSQALMVTAAFISRSRAQNPQRHYYERF